MALTKISRSLLDTGVSDSSDATAITIGSNEKVGIGTTSTDHQLSVNAADFDGIQLLQGGTDTGYIGVYHDGSSTGRIYLGGLSSVDIQTGNGGVTDGTTRVRVDSSGVGIGTTSITSSTGWSPKLVLSDTSAGLILKGINSQECNIGVSNGLYLDALGSTTASNNMIIFRTSNSNSNFSAAIRMAIDSSGSITMNNLYGSAADQNDVRYNASSGLLFYNTSSRRYKENIKDMPDGVLDKIKQARVVTFDEKGTDVSSYGLIAEELDELIPELVTRKEIDGELVPESIVYSKIGVWVLKAMQEQQEQIEALQSEINTLKGE